MNRVIFTLFVFFLTGCSFTKTSFWTQDKEIQEVKKNTKIIFKKKEIIKKEFNQNFILDLKNSDLDFKKNYLTNNLGIKNLNTEVSKRSKFKFSKIKDFEYHEPELNFDGENFIFFDDKGTLLKFDPDFKIIWKKNYYTKQEKKLKPILTFTNNGKLLVVFDNISKYYAVDLSTGDLIWSKISKNPSNSQIKVFKDKVYSVDLNNVLRCFSIIDGSEIWNFKSENTFLKSNKRNSLIIKNDIVLINNSLGDISAINANDGSLIWQLPTQSSDIYESAFNLIMSDLVSINNYLVFSNNRNEFFSINLINGVVNWKQEINSSVMPLFYGNLIFSISDEGYFFVVDSKSGNVLRITDIFENMNKKKRSKIKPIGFIAGTKKILLSTNSGKLLIINISDGKTEKVLKIDNEKISRPFVFNNNLVLVTNNSIIKLN